MQQNKSAAINWKAVLIRVLFTAILLGTVVFIFSNSHQAGALSGIRSERVTAWVNAAFAKVGLGVTISELAIRKLGHLAEFMLLGFWLMLTLRVYTRRVVAFISWPLLAGLLVAVCDEFYQTFVPGRSGQMSDVLIDFAGVLLGIVAAMLCILLCTMCWRALRKK